MKVQRHHTEIVVRWQVAHLVTVPKYFRRICLDYVFLGTLGKKSKMKVCIRTMSSFFSLFARVEPRQELGLSRTRDIW